MEFFYAEIPRPYRGYFYRECPEPPVTMNYFFYILVCINDADMNMGKNISSRVFFFLPLLRFQLICVFKSKISLFKRHVDGP